MINKKMTLKSWVAQLLIDTANEDNLPVEIVFGVIRNGYAEVLISYTEENEHVYEDLMKSVDELFEV